MAQGFTLEQLKNKGEVRTIKQGGATLQELLSMGGKEVEKNTGIFKYDVGETFENKLTRANQQANQAKIEAEKASSPGGFFKNFIRSAGDLATVGTTKLGDTLSGIVSTNATSDTFSRANENNTQTLLRYQRMIKEKESKGEDATNLKRLYNQVVDQMEKDNKTFSEISKPTQKTNLQVGGEILGTGVDLFALGSYGKNATTGLQSFKLGNVKPTVIPTGSQKLLSKETVKEVGLGSLFGYGFDVSSGLQGDRGEKNKGAGSLVPGLGTGLGALLPVAIKGSQSAGNIRKNIQESGGIGSAVNDMTIQKIKKDINNLLSRNKTIQNKVSLFENQRNIPIKEYLSRPEIFSGLKVRDGSIVAEESVNLVQRQIDDLMQAKSGIIDEVEQFIPKTSKEVLRKEAVDSVSGVTTPADEKDIIKSINKQIDALPGELSVRQLDDLRSSFRKASRDARDLQKRNSEYTILENVFRDKVFKVTDNLPFDTNKEFASLNNEIKNLIGVQNFIEKNLSGSKVKGGRLGTYTARVLGGIAGSTKGPFGAILGSEIGATVSRIIQNSQLGSSFKMKLIRNMTDDPQVLNMAKDLIERTKNYNPLSTPALSSGSITVGPRSSLPSSRVINASKGDPGRNPETGKFFRTFRSDQ